MMNMRSGGMRGWSDLWGSLGEGLSSADWEGAANQLLQNYTGADSAGQPLMYPPAPAPIIIQQPAAATGGNTGMWIAAGLAGVALIGGGIYVATRKGK